MPKRSSKGEPDINQLAAAIVAKTAGSQTKTLPTKNPAAVALGRLGGLKGGKARAAKLTSRKRRAIARKGAKARWKARPE